MDTLKIAAISIGKDEVTKFQETLGLYTNITNFNISRDATSEDISAIEKELSAYNLIIAAVHDHSKFPRNGFELSDAGKQFISRLSSEDNVVMTFFKNPYVVNDIDKIEKSSALIMGYQDNDNSEDLAAQLIFGGDRSTWKVTCEYWH